MEKFLLFLLNLFVFYSTSFSQISSTPPSYVCVGSSISFSVPSQLLGTTFDWQFSGASPSSTTSTIPSPTVTFNSAGISLIQLTINQGTSSQYIFPPINLLVQGSTPTVTNPSITIPSTFCEGTPLSVSYVITGGGPPILSTGVLIPGLIAISSTNITLGLIKGHTLTISGTPTISGCLISTYTTSPILSCPSSTPATINLNSICINQKPTASISYTGSPFCKTLTSPQSINLSGSDGVIYPSLTAIPHTGGTYSASPAGLSINVSTGAITPSTSTASTYTVTYTVAAAGGCAALTTTASVAITAAPTAAISYVGSPFCKTLSTAQPVTLSGTLAYTGGTYSSTSGLSININTGAINPSLSTAGTYTVTYTTPASGGCAAVTTTTNVTITDLPTATISYSDSPYCRTITTAQPVTQTGATGGIYSSTTGLSLDAGLVSEGYSQARYLQRKGSEIKNVYLFFTENQNEAINEKSKYTSIDENVWVLKIE